MNATTAPVAIGWKQPRSRRVHSTHSCPAADTAVYRLRPLLVPADTPDACPHCTPRLALPPTCPANANVAARYWRALDPTTRTDTAERALAAELAR